MSHACQNQHSNFTLWNYQINKASVSTSEKWKNSDNKDDARITQKHRSFLEIIAFHSSI